MRSCDCVTVDDSNWFCEHQSQTSDTAASDFPFAEPSSSLGVWRRSGRRFFMASAVLTGSLGLLGGQQASAAGCADSDGDGYGWDGSATCDPQESDDQIAQAGLNTTLPDTTILEIPAQWEPADSGGEGPEIDLDAVRQNGKRRVDQDGTVTYDARVFDDPSDPDSTVTRVRIVDKPHGAVITWIGRGTQPSEGTVESNGETGRYTREKTLEIGGETYGRRLLDRVEGATFNRWEVDRAREAVAGGTATPEQEVFWQNMNPDLFVPGTDMLNQELSEAIKHVVEGGITPSYSNAEVAEALDRIDRAIAVNPGLAVEIDQRRQDHLAAQHWDQQDREKGSLLLLQQQERIHGLFAEQTQQVSDPDSDPPNFVDLVADDFPGGNPGGEYWGTPTLSDRYISGTTVLGSEWDAAITAISNEVATPSQEALVTEVLLTEESPESELELELELESEPKALATPILALSLSPRPPPRSANHKSLADERAERADRDAQQAADEYAGGNRIGGEFG